MNQMSNSQLFVAGLDGWIPIAWQLFANTSRHGSYIPWTMKGQLQYLVPLVKLIISEICALDGYSNTWLFNWTIDLNLASLYEFLQLIELFDICRFHKTQSLCHTIHVFAEILQTLAHCNVVMWLWLLSIFHVISYLQCKIDLNINDRYSRWSSPMAYEKLYSWSRIMG